MDEFFTTLLAFIVKAQNELADGELPPFVRIHGAERALAEARAIIADIPSGSVILEEAITRASGSLIGPLDLPRDLR